MPTYSYRCQHCQAVQSVVHGINEMAFPECLSCGGLTSRIVTQAPTVTGRTSPHKEEIPVPETDSHTCHSACVLHQSSPPSPLKSSPTSQPG